MKILVVGGSGFIGRSFEEQAKKKGLEIVSVGSQEINLIEPHSTLQLKEKLRDCDALVFLSALTPKKGLTAVENMVRFMDNLRMAENVYKALAASQVNYVLYVSSDSVYSPEESEIDELSKTDPDSLYGLAHKIRERLLSEICQAKGFCILRPCALYGLEDPHNGYGPNRFVREAIERKTITLFGEGEELRHHLSVKDLAEIMCHMLKHRKTGVYNVASEEPVSFLEVAKVIQAKFPFQIKINFVPRAVSIQHKTHNLTKLKKEMPEFRFTDLKTGIELLSKSF